MLQELCYATPEELIHGTGELRMIAIDAGFADAIDTMEGTNNITDYLSPRTEKLSCTEMLLFVIWEQKLVITVTYTHQASLYSSYPKADVDTKCDQVIEITLSELEHHIHGPFTSHLSRSLIIEITLSELEHHIHGPFTSHLSRSLSKFNSII
ncbi:hypothetical protein Glove_399g34 [Diversispora epigaea]|uniref:Uncharacterized protein n=1 Tax=Diversispora epigaea TaxID=1348612 RepID=A0A397H426_9GLOM|nr:hypothetical protein Glove_399g34 [Diversispora epigaea]